jgi:hypothetical protein
VLQEVRLGMYVVLSHDLIGTLTRRADDLQQELLARLLEDCRQMNKE